MRAAGLVDAVGELGRDFPFEEDKVDPLSNVLICLKLREPIAEARADNGYCSKFRVDKEAILGDLDPTELLAYRGLIFSLENKKGFKLNTNR